MHNNYRATENGLFLATLPNPMERYSAPPNGEMHSSRKCNY